MRECSYGETGNEFFAKSTTAFNVVAGNWGLSMMLLGVEAISTTGMQSFSALQPGLSMMLGLTVNPLELSSVEISSAAARPGPVFNDHGLSPEHMSFWPISRPMTSYRLPTENVMNLPGLLGQVTSCAKAAIKGALQMLASNRRRIFYDISRIF